MDRNEELDQSIRDLQDVGAKLKELGENAPTELDKAINLLAQGANIQAQHAAILSRSLNTLHERLSAVEAALRGPS